MKAFIILALTLTVNSSFLRELTAEAITLEDPVFTTKCIVSAVAGEIEFSVTVDKKDFSTADGFTATLKSGDNTFTVDGAGDKTTTSKIVFSNTAVTSNKAGIYTLSAVADKTATIIEII